MCPYGTDVLDTRQDLLLSANYQVQQIIFLPSQEVAGYADGGANGQVRGRTFALTFKSRLNETFTTIPIVFDSTDVPDFVHDIQLALLNLPNRVIDGITVAASTTASSTSYWANQVTVNITFTGNAVQGPQHLLSVEDYECAAGCTPKLTGLNLQTRYDHLSSNVTEVQSHLSDYNSYECGRRGKCDYATGLCNCFTGYTGENCNTLTTLV